MRKNSGFLLGLWIILGAVLASAATPAAESLSVMSYNIRCLTMEDDWRDLWWFRKKQVARVIAGAAPDMLGLQEVYTSQAHDLEKLLPGYAWFGPPRDDGKRKGERNPIFYRKDRFELLAQNSFWLSETPEVPGSKSWDAACKRIVTWGKFRDKKNGKIFFHFNTHFDHKGKKAREKSAELLVERIKKLAGDSPYFVTGDFNTDDRSLPYLTLKSLMLDSRVICSTPAQGPENTSWSFKPQTPPEERIDYIFVSPTVSVSKYQALDQTYGKGRRPSDHIPVMVSLQIP